MLFRWLNVVETVGRQYAFIKFGKGADEIPGSFVAAYFEWQDVFSDRVIQKRRRDYSDPNSTSNMKKLNDDLHTIHNIMRKTIDDVIDRGSKLEGAVLVV